MSAQPITRTLADVVRDALADAPDADPSALAEKLLGNLDDGLVREAAWSGLLSAIRAATSLSQARRLAAVPRKAQPSWRVQAAQARAFARIATEHGSKTLDDCDRDDLMFSAAVSRRLAEGNLKSEAAKLRLVEELDRAKVRTVGELPADLVRTVLAGTDLTDGA
jgi:hypothetical protein